ncbi:MAG TPA: protein-methionine-sulfoxide reductase heme-binding subunit MsrQ [Methylomirabilota bacterium]|jgi:sulfoxide reductase heme-binding subunit YedZ|nr:protein-methionine-sulfoxide reductase heme-binding subunit MsrQ [Methylomirabilota bacterium]
MRRLSARIALKSGVWAACLTPLALVVYWTVADDLGINPIEAVTRWLGVWTLRLLLLSLTMTPLRLLFGLSWPITLRRLLGLFAFFYATLHFGVWIVVDHFFDWPTMGADIAKRPYIMAGLGALVMLVPLAATSTAGMVKRLGAPAWRRLHRLAYLAAVLAVLHFLWLAKVGRVTPFLYAAWLALVLGIRLWAAARRIVARRRRRRAEADAVPA